MIMTINFLDSESEGDPSIGERLHANSAFGEITLLDSVSIDNDGQGIETILLRAHCRFPVRTFLKFPVANEHKHPPRFTPHARRQSHAHPNWQRMTKRSGIGFHARQFVFVRVSVQHRERIHERLQRLERKKTPLRQSRIKSTGAVSFGHHKAISQFPTRIGWIYPQNST